MGKSVKTVPGSDTAVAICTHCSDKRKAHKLTPEEKALIQPGANVMVNCCGEGFFVWVDEVKGETIRGVVNNDLIKCKHWHYRDQVELTMDEVYEVVPKED